VEEVLHLGASEGEIAETLDIGAIMGGTISMKSVRHAFAVMDDLKRGSAQ
jgi:alkylhydroperoxidase/carboxymuconolactone decarboxylase family protein YurZ